MEKEIKIGPIQKKNNSISLNKDVYSQIKKMKVGEYFEITGVDARTVANLRNLFSQRILKNGERVSTRFKNNT